MILQRLMSLARQLNADVSYCLGTELTFWAENMAQESAQCLIDIAKVNGFNTTCWACHSPTRGWWYDVKVKTIVKI